MNFLDTAAAPASLLGPSVDAGMPREVRADILHAIDRAYRALVEEQSRQDLLRGLCQGLAEAMDLSLVALVRRHKSGTIELEAASRENLIWAELMRLPERSDGTIAGHGPAARALHAGLPVSIATTDEGFLPWREAARRDGITQVCAWPLETASPEWVLMLFASSARHQQVQVTGGQAGVAAAACARLFQACDRLARQRLLSAALEHAGNAAFVADTEGRIAWCNAAFSQLSGYGADEILGRNPRFLSSGRHGARHYRELWNTLRTGRVWRGETVDRDASGAAFTAIQTISPFGTADRVTHYLAIYEDISRQKSEQVARELRTGQDPVTGLMHRAAMEQRLTERIAQGQPLRVGLVAVGSVQGLAPSGAVDALVGEMQARIRNVMGQEEAARWTPGEYLLHLPTDAEQARMKLETLASELRDPYPLIGEIKDLDLRVGQAMRQDGDTLDTLLQRVDRALGVEPLRPAHRAMLPN